MRRGKELFTEHTEVPHNQSIFESAQTGNTQIRAQIADAVGRDLSRVIAAWPQLPAPLKVAILAIVSSVNATQEVDS